MKKIGYSLICGLLCLLFALPAFAQPDRGPISGAANATMLQGRPLANTAPTNTQTICWDAASSTWKPCDPSTGDVVGPGSSTDGYIVTWTGTQGINVGVGVAQNTFQSADADLTAIAAVSGSTGMTLYYNTGWYGLAATTNGYVMTLSGGLPVWATPAAAVAHNILSAAHTDTLTDSSTLGDLIHGNATSVWARLAGNTTAVKQFLTQTGTGAVSAVPAWGAIASGDLPATITGLTSVSSITFVGALTGTASGNVVGPGSSTDGYIVTWTGTDGLHLGVGVAQSTFASTVTWVPIDGDIETYVTAATAGDTLVLAGGTYTITDDIDIAQAINIIGQGIDETIILCATNSKNVFDITASNVRISNLSITNTGDTSRGINAGPDLSGLVFSNLKITTSGASQQIGYYITGSNAIIRDNIISVTSSDSLSWGIGLINFNTTTVNAVVDIYNTKVTAAGVGAIGNPVYAYSLYNNNDANTVTMNLYDCYGTATASDVAARTLRSQSTTTNTATLNVYGGAFSGLDYDAIQDGTNSLNLYGAVLVNNLTSGTITSTGTMRIGAVTATTFTGALTGTASNASQLLTKTWAAPDAIGSGTPAAGTFTSVTATTGGISSSQGATGGYLKLLEGSGGGTNFRTISSPDALTADLELRHADALPAANQFQLYPAPTTGVSQYVWTTYGIFATAITPSAAGGQTIGTTALEWGNVYLTDGAVIYGQANQGNTMTSSTSGWTFNLGITAPSVTITDATNDNYLAITNNAGGRAPTASAWEQYPDAGIWKTNQNGTEYANVLSPLAGQVIFAGPSAPRTVTLPNADFTVARTDAANTFTGHQTIEGVTSTGATGTGLLVFNDTAILIAPALGAATAASLLATGIVDGTAPILIVTTSAGVTLGGTYKSGYTFTNPIAAAATFIMTLPTPAAVGMQYCTGNGAAKTGILTINAGANNYIDLDGTLGSAGGYAQATAVAGNFACFVGTAAYYWKALPTKGTWTIAGP